MSLKRRALIGVAANYARFGVPMVVTLVVTPVVVGALGPDGYGLWSLTFAVVGVLGLLDFGLTTGTVRFVGEARGRGDLAERNRAIATLAVLYALLATVAVLALTALAVSAPRALQVPVDRRALGTALIWLLGLRVAAVQLPFGLFRNVLFAEQRIPALAVIQSIASVLNGGAVIGVLAAGGGLVGMGVVNLAVGVLEHAAYAWLAVRTVPGFGLPLRSVRFPDAWRTVRFGLSQLVVNVASLIRLRTDPMIVKLFVSLPAVGVYAIGLKVAEYAHLLVMQGLNVVSALTAELHGASDRTRLQELFLRSGKYALGLAAVVAVTAATVGTSALTLWVGVGFAGAGPVLAVLTASTACSALGASAGGVLAMTGHHRRAAWVAAGAAAINVAVSIALVRPFGMVGVALGTLASSLIADGAVLPIMACRVVRVSLGAYVRGVIRPVVAPVAVQVAVLALARAALPLDSLGALVSVTVLGCIGFVLGFLVFGLDAAERSSITKLLRAVGMRRRARPSLNGFAG